MDFKTIGKIKLLLFNGSQHYSIPLEVYAMFSAEV